MSRARLAAVLAAGVLVVVIAIPGAPLRAADDRSVSVAPGIAKPGQLVIVSLDGWRRGNVVVGVCGNNARRGSDDCALAGDVGVAIRDPKSTTRVNLIVAAPPVPCPCVVRAATLATDVVRTTPILLLGVPIGPELVPTGGAPTPKQLRIRARVVDGDQSLLAPLAGSASCELVLTIRNRGADPVRGLRIVGTVGRDRGTGEPLPPIRVREIGSHSTKTVRVPFDLAFPAFGDSSVSGSVYGLSAPARFATTTSNDPWALEIAAVLALVLCAQLLRRRDRARKAAEGAVAPADATPVAGGSDEMLPQSSPAVVDPDGERSPVPAYDPPTSGHWEPRVDGEVRQPETAPMT